MPPNTIENWIWYFNTAAAGALMAWMYAQHLAGTYRVLFLFLLVDVAQSAGGIAFYRHLTTFALIYLVGQILKLFLEVFFAYDLCRLALAQQPALAKFGQRMILYLVAIAAAISAGGLWISSVVRGDAPPWQSVLRFEQNFLSFEFTIDSLVMIVLMLFSVFLFWFPVKVRRNVALYIGGFIVYSFAHWSGVLTVVIWRTMGHAMNIAIPSVGTACLIFWLSTLRRSGEFATTLTGHRWNPEEANRLNDQLNAINARLMSLVH